MTPWTGDSITPTLAYTQGLVLNDILVDTGRPDLLIQFYLTLQYTLSCYNDIATFDMVDNSTQIQMFVNNLVLKPGWGYWTVTAIILCHISLVSAITICYLAIGGSENFLGNAVRQLKSKVIEDVLESTSGTDSDVRKLLNRKGIDEKDIGLQQDDEGNYRITIS